MDDPIDAGTLTNDGFADLARKLATRRARVGVIGLGYVGLPLAAAAAKVGFRVTGFDIDAAKPRKILAATSYIPAVSDATLRTLVGDGRLTATIDFAALGDCDVIVVCVPTPLGPECEPNLSFVTSTAETIARFLRPGQLVSLESTSYPGTTREVLKPILEATGLLSGRDVFLGFSPEREDPGRSDYTITDIPKVISGDGAEAVAAMTAFYGAVVQEVIPVSSLETAEAVKIAENVFRAVNIALANELKIVLDAMGVDVWEVVEAAKTKPFGYMPFYPGPGLGGHCIPIDPFYLSWKSRRNGITPRLIELAGEINLSMPQTVIENLSRALLRRKGIRLTRATILVLGLTYKKNVPDLRESPALKLLDLLHDAGAHADFHDPLIARVPVMRDHPKLEGMRSVALRADAVASYDAVLIATDHDGVDYALVATHAALVVDTRNAMARGGFCAPHIVNA